MSSTTTDRPTIVTTHDPFSTVLQQAEQRVQSEAAEKERLAEERRLERVRLQAEREQERQRLEAKRQADQFVTNVKNWIGGFFAAVAKTAEAQKWQPAAILEAKAYCEALVLQGEGHELPKIDPTMGKIIHGKFAFGIALDHVGRKVIPESFFVGQRQEWFPRLLDLKIDDITRQHKR
jgi:hypothetical protein